MRKKWKQSMHRVVSFVLMLAMLFTMMPMALATVDGIRNVQVHVNTSQDYTDDITFTSDYTVGDRTSFTIPYLSSYSQMSAYDASTIDVKHVNCTSVSDTWKTQFDEGNTFTTNSSAGDIELWYIVNKMPERKGSGGSGGTGGDQTDYLHKFTLKYNVNGGTPSIANQVNGSDGQYTTSLSFTITSTAPTRENFVFAGWKDKNNRIHQAGTSYTLYGPSGVYTKTNYEETLTAVWTAKPISKNYELIYNYNYGEMKAFTRQTDTSTTGSCLFDNLAGAGTPTRSDYTFKGWSTTSGENNSDGKITSLTMSDPTTSQTIYAIWEAIPQEPTYSVTYVDRVNKDDAVPEIKEYEAGETVNIDTTDRDKGNADNLVFLGWKYDGVIFPIDGSATLEMPGEDIKLIASWATDKDNDGKPDYEENQFVLVYDDNIDYEYSKQEDLHAGKGNYLDKEAFPPQDGKYILIIREDQNKYWGEPKRWDDTGIYRFVEWNTQANHEGTAYADGAKLPEVAVADGEKTFTQTIYAIWEGTITFDANGGSATSEKNVIIKDPMGTLPEPTKTGFTFDGWYTAATGGTKVTANTIMQTNITLYAQWIDESAITYTVTYQPGLAPTTTAVPANADYAKDAEVTVSSTIPVWEGHKFEGWQYQNNTPYWTGGHTFKMPADDVILAAMWSEIEADKITYQIVFKRNDGTDDVHETLTQESVATSIIFNFDLVVAEKLDLENITRAGYTFKGWAESATGAVVTDNFSEYIWGVGYDTVEAFIPEGYRKIDLTKTTPTKTYYAIWEQNTTTTPDPVTHTVSFDENGGKKVPDQTVNDKATITAPTTTRKGYDFKCWTLNGKKFDFTQPITGDIELVAKWDKIEDDDDDRPAKKYEIEIDQDGEGAIFPGGGDDKTIEVTEHTDKKFTITPADGYEIADVLIDGKSVGDVSAYTFENIRDDHEIEVIFALIDQAPDSMLNREDHFAYMQGYPDDSFAPGQNITRAETAVMFSRLLTETMDANRTYTTTFTDVKPTDWYANQVGYMEQLGILSGYEDGSFRGDASITRAEFAAIASRFDALEEVNVTMFYDVQLTHWASDCINSSAKKGWVNGYPDGTFKPEQYITRAEAVTLVNNVLNRECDVVFVETHPQIIRHFTDMSNAYWAYYEVMEAAHTHDYDRVGAGEVWLMVD